MTIHNESEQSEFEQVQVKLAEWHEECERLKRSNAKLFAILSISIVVALMIGVVLWVCMCGKLLAQIVLTVVLTTTWAVFAKNYVWNRLQENKAKRLHLQRAKFATENFRKPTLNKMLAFYDYLEMEKL